MRRPEFVARQSACPAGLLGRLIGHVMARETASANEVAVELLELKPTDHVLEVGFGHGATIERVAAAVSGGLVAGIDPSPEMCRMAARRNRCAIARGCVELRAARAETIPYPDERFDKVLSVHTLYFWPDLARPLREIARVLKPGGTLVLAHRSDPGAAQEFPDTVYRFASAVVVTAAITAAGLVETARQQNAFGRATVSYHVAHRP